MTTRTTAFAPGTPCWVDLLSSDVTRAKDFYSALFGWTFEEAGPEFGNYVRFSSDGHDVAGLMANSPESGTPDVWTTYLAVDDAEKSVEAAVSAGAQLIVAPMQVGPMGSMAVVIDPAGAAIGVWQAGEFGGFRKYNEAGAVTWDELQSRDFAATVAFYPQVFGWELDKTSDTDEFRYFNATVAGEPVAGLMDSAAFLPAGVRSHWAVYFNVDSADEAAAKVAQLGGSVTTQPQDTPYGRIVDALDPTGAAFKLHQANKQS